MIGRAVVVCWSSLLVLLAGTLSLVRPAPAAAQPYSICIDPGHGGSDPGAVGCGLEEEDVNLDVALRLRDLLQADPDLTPLMTRSTDATVSLQARTDYANDQGVTRFVSIHSNAFNGAASGIETYCHLNAGGTSIDQRDRIQAAMVAAWPGLPNRGGKKADFHVVRETAMPATLSELAFIDNCGSDAQYLGDPARRQQAAVAHHTAIRASLGLGGTAPPTGAMRGAVFEDLGVGTADMSVRLPGATVTVTGPGGSASAVAAAGDALWHFDLTAGAWLVRAEHPGYAPAERTCAVSAGTTIWCSVGLFPATPPPPEPTDVPPDVPVEPDVPPPPPDVPPDIPAPPDVPAPEPDIPAEPDVPPDVPAPPDIPAPEPDVPAPPDAARPGPDTGRADLGLVDPPDTDEAGGGGGGGGGGCAAADGAPAPLGPIALLVLLGGLALLALSRRRAPRTGFGARAGLAALAAAALAGAGCDPAPTAPSRPAPAAAARQHAVVEAPVTAALPAERGPERPLTELRTLVPAGDWGRPVWSPDGAHLALSSRDLATLYVARADAGAGAAATPRALVRAPRAGYAPVWAADGATLGYRTPEQRSDAVPLLSVAVADGAPAAPPRNRTPGVWLRVADDAVHLRTGAVERRVSPDGDRYCCAVLSPDGRFVAFQGLTTGLHVHDRESGRTHALGAGHHAAFAPDGRTLAFDRTTDDGERLTGATLHLAVLPADAAGAVLVQDLAGAPPLARFPTFAPDGRRIAFETPDGVVTARIGE